jgi:hypothetical protein
VTGGIYQFFGRYRGRDELTRVRDLLLPEKAFLGSKAEAY